MGILRPLAALLCWVLTIEASLVAVLNAWFSSRSLTGSNTWARATVCALVALGAACASFRLTAPDWRSLAFQAGVVAAFLQLGGLLWLIAQAGC